MSVSLDEVPAVAAVAWVRLRDEFRSILGDRLIALWGYGAKVFPDPPRLLGDIGRLEVHQKLAQFGVELAATRRKLWIIVC